MIVISIDKLATQVREKLKIPLPTWQTVKSNINIAQYVANPVAQTPKITVRYVTSVWECNHLIHISK